MPATASPSTMSPPIAAIPQLAELNIGHFLVGEAIFTGFEASVRADARADGRGAGMIEPHRHPRRLHPREVTARLDETPAFAG